MENPWKESIVKNLEMNFVEAVYFFTFVNIFSRISNFIIYLCIVQNTLGWIVMQFDIP
jgi:hypothetical protein